MRKFLTAMVAALVGVGSYAMIAGAADGPGKTSWTFKFAPAKAGKSTKTHSLIEPAVQDDKGTPDETDDEYAAAKKTTILFPKGSAFDTSVPPRCKAEGGELAATRGSVCKKADIGSGAAISIIGSGERRSRLAATIDAYNKKNGIFFLIQPCFEGTGPGQADPKCSPLGNPFVLEGKLGYADRKKTQPRLIVPTPKSLLDNNVIISRFELQTDNITKTKRVNGKKTIFAYTTTPSTCKGKWATKAIVKYTDRPKVVFKDSFICKG